MKKLNSLYFSARLQKLIAFVYGGDCAEDIEQLLEYNAFIIPR